jgi:DNA polymerase-4
MKTILHIDMNSYFPAVEELLNPNLRNKPVIVGGKSRRSVVSSANYIAREYGVRAAMPMYKAIMLCPKAIVVEPNFANYQLYHDKFIELIRDNFSDKIEDSSIDECFVDITKLVKNKSPKLIALKIQNMIKNKIGLKCSIGIAHNKFMAKMGSDFKKPLGITQMYKEDVVSKL